MKARVRRRCFIAIDRWIDYCSKGLTALRIKWKTFIWQQQHQWQRCEKSSQKKFLRVFCPIFLLPTRQQRIHWMSGAITRDFLSLSLSCKSSAVGRPVRLNNVCCTLVRLGDVLVEWIHFSLSSFISCSHGFESQAHHLCLNLCNKC